MIFFSAAFPKLAAGIRLVGVALKFVFITNPWIGIIIAIIAAVVLLDRKFHFLAPTIKFIGRLFTDIFNWIRTHWKQIIEFLIHPFTFVYNHIKKWANDIIGFFKGIIDWVTQHWKILLLIILGPFAIGGAILIGIHKFADRFLEIIKVIPIKIVGFFKSLPDQLKKIFDKIPGLLKDALKGLGGIVKSALEKIPGFKAAEKAFGGIKSFLGGGGKSDEQKFAALVKEPALDEQDVKKAKRLHQQGMKTIEIITKLVKDQGITQDQAAALIKKYSFQQGGTVPGGEGQAVPIIAHAGEWVLNRKQQEKLARMIGTTKDKAKVFLFGPNYGEREGPVNTAQKDEHNPFGGPKRYRGPGFFYNLVPETDPSGSVVWFIEFDDGTFGQISKGSALKIQRSNGKWFPPSVKRDTHGFTRAGQASRAKSEGFAGWEGRPDLAAKALINMRKLKKRAGMRGASDAGGYSLGGIVQSLARGGVVQKWAGPMLQSFAEGGTVLNQSGLGAENITSSKNIEQNFHVTTQGETDWNYVLRLGAIHAAGSY